MECVSGEAQMRESCGESSSHKGKARRNLHNLGARDHHLADVAEGEGEAGDDDDGEGLELCRQRQEGEQQVQVKRASERGERQEKRRGKGLEKGTGSPARRRGIAAKGGRSGE